MVALTIDSLTSLPLEEAINLLCISSESLWFDRKSGKINPKDLAPHICAFANSEGGLIALGIQNKTPAPISTKRTNEFRQGIYDTVLPVPRHHIEHLKLGDDEFILLIEIPASSEVHYTSDNDCYLRVGDSSRKLSHSQIQELEFDRGARNYEDTPTRSLISDLDSSFLESFAEKIGSPSAERALSARGMLTQDKEVRVCGYLMFAENPQLEFPSAFVRVLKYAENTRGTGGNQTLVAGADIRCEGALPVQISKAVETVENFLPTRRVLGPENTFINTSLIPKGAWLEGIVNAVVHRSYSISGDHIRVEIFPNRIEITSPGRFPGLADPTQPTEINRFARNPRIARAFADLDITQELGEGIRRIFSEMRNVGLADPVYKQGSENVRLILHALDNIPEELRKTLGAAVSTLEIIRRENRPLGTGEIIDLTGLKRPTVLRHLRTLRENGIIWWDGKSLNDPRATWRIL